MAVKERKKNLVLKRLREKNRINEKLEVMVSEISLEDLITLKLEISSKNLSNKLFGFGFWRNIDFIIRDSFIKFAVNRTGSIREAAAILGMRPAAVKAFIEKYNLSEDFSEKHNNQT